MSKRKSINSLYSAKMEVVIYWRSQLITLQILRGGRRHFESGTSFSAYKDIFVEIGENRKTNQELVASNSGSLWLHHSQRDDLLLFVFCPAN